MSCEEKLRLSIAYEGSVVLPVQLDWLTPHKLREQIIRPCGLFDAVRRNADETFTKAWVLGKGWYSSEEHAAARRLEARLKGVYFERALSGT